MPIIDELQQGATLVAAVIAAIASVLNLRSKSDRIKVVFGHLYPPLDPGEALYVVSRRDHQMKLRDYGFIDNKGALLSLPQYYAYEWEGDDDVPIDGRSHFEKRGEIFQFGPAQFRHKQIGAFAITAGQRFRRVAFHADVPWHVRLRLRFKIAFKPDQQ